MIYAKFKCIINSCITLDDIFRIKRLLTNYLTKYLKKKIDISLSEFLKQLSQIQVEYPNFCFCCAIFLFTNTSVVVLKEILYIPVPK